MKTFEGNVRDSSISRNSKLYHDILVSSNRAVSETINNFVLKKDLHLIINAIWHRNFIRLFYYLKEYISKYLYK